MNHAYRTLSRAVQRSKTRAKRESRREKLRGSATIALTNPINGDIGSLVRSYKHRERDPYSPPTLCRPSFRGRSFPFAALFLIPLRSLATAIALPHENSSTFHAASSASLSLFRSRSLAREFSSGVKGRDPGATVSKYDTGIGYKETINHSRARANGIRTASE